MLSDMCSKEITINGRKKKNIGITSALLYIYIYMTCNQIVCK